MSTASQEFKNDNLSIQTSREPGCRVKFDINVSPLAAEAAYRKAIKNIKKEVSLPGFRKGKAPDAIILQNYDKHIDSEWRDLIVKTAFQEALDLTKIYPLNENSVKRPNLKSASREEGCELTIEMEVMPEIPQVDPKDMTLTKPKRKDIVQEDVDNAIMDLRLHHAEWADVTDREVQEGDYVDLDVDNIDDPENPLCRDMRFEASKGKMGNWMLKLVLGKQINDVVEGTSEKETAADADADFKPTNCRITIKSIRTPQLPELNDEFAAKVGLKTIDELKSRVEEDLNKQSDELVQTALRTQAEQFLGQNYDFDIPLSLFEGEKKSRLQRIQQLKQKATPEQIVKLEEKYTDESVSHDVLTSLRLFFLTRKIADDNKIQVSQDEIMQEMMQHLYNPQSGLIDPSMEADEIRSKLYLNILDRKIKDFIVDNANIK